MVKKKKTVPLSVKVEHDVFMLLDDYYRSLNAIGYTKSRLVNDAINEHLLTLSKLKCQVDARMNGLKDCIKSD
jgi:hypothetical protein